MSRAELRPGALDLGTKSLEGIEAQLDEVLRQLQRKVRGIRGSVVADSNGLTIASDIREGVSPATLAAMSTLIAQSAGSVFENIEMPGPDLIMMEGPESNVVVMHIPIADVTLLTLMDKATNIGVLKIEMGKATQGIATALGFGTSHKAPMSELFIMTKGGLLIRHYSDSLLADLDRDAVSGLLAAVEQFQQQTLTTKT